MSRLVLGTAGHIDHGKTSLVHALTGVDTDRLKEEKERGITIDLGFARLDLGDGEWAGIVDVPGHEGFIRNMVAGAAGIDAVLLVIAADEGVMPQTREHLAIIELLGVEHGVVALSKSDLVESDWLELVAEDVRDTLSGTSIESAEIVPASVRTGGGLDALSGALRELLGQIRIPEVRARDVFRLPVDRSFTVRGTGTVATGTVWSGTVATGGQVRVRPGDERARIRGIEVHGAAADRAAAGQRTAVALVGLQPEQVPRGAQLVALDEWEDTTRVTARVRMLAGAEHGLERGQRVRVHLGTAEVMARAFPAGGVDIIGAGETDWVELRLEGPVLARARDRFVLRSYSPMATIGGGQIAEPHPPRRKLGRTPVALLATLVDGEAAAATRAALELAGASGVHKALLAIRTGLPAPDDLSAVGFDVGGHVFALPFAEQVRAEIMERTRAYHEEAPLDPGVPVERLRGRIQAPTTLVDESIRGLESESRVTVEDGRVRLPDFAPVLDQDSAAWADRVRAAYREAGLSPPRVPDLVLDEVPESRRWPLVRFLDRAGDLIQLEDDLFVWRPHFLAAVDKVRATLAGRSGLGPADFREALGVSRKFMLPLLHRLDQDGVTIRQDGARSVPA